MKLLDLLFGQPGAAVPHRKAAEEQETVTMPAPAAVTVSLSQHIGAPCKPLVAVGDTVTVGQCVADSDRPVSAPIHSPVSGRVRGITNLRQAGGQVGQAILIENDGENRLCPDIAPPVVTDRASFLEAVRRSGLVGLGGAGFPTHVKLDPPKGDLVHTLIINAAECEPYITSDYRECMEAADDIMAGIAAVMKWLELSHTYIGIESNKPKAISLLRKKAAELPGVSVKVLPSRYPQGAEKMLIQTCLGRRVPEGGLPANIGVIVMNVTTVGFLGRYLATGMPLITKRVTVAGGGVPNPQNVQVAIGTPLSALLDFCGGMSDDTTRLLMGGPMMGIAVGDTTLPVLKQNNAILALTDEELKPRPVEACLRCGRCVAACPMHLVPTSISEAFDRGDMEELEKRHLFSCLECGCCAYTCPANRPLVQTFRQAKAQLRDKK